MNLHRACLYINWHPWRFGRSLLEEHIHVLLQNKKTRLGLEWAALLELFTLLLHLKRICILRLLVLLDVHLELLIEHLRYLFLV